jgi:excisionase family DNA binding protein
MNKKYLWPHELGREVGVASSTVRRLADAGELPYVRDAHNRRRFPPEAIEVIKKKMGLATLAVAAE